MRILGIETSFDETGAAVVENGTTILSEALATSADMHRETGGVVPEKAARQQISSMLPVIEKALADASLEADGLDAVAVTHGPGLIGSLLVGVETAKALSYAWGVPLVPVNHLVAHLYANFVRDNKQNRAGKVPQFPAIGLVASGGHTDMVYLKDHRNLNVLGSTRDDAAGEAFDKSARLLGFPYPGGPLLAAAADKFLSRHSGKQPLTLFPRPMIDSDGYDFSFSGLKTAVLNYTKSFPEKLDKSHLGAEVQEAMVDVIVAKSLRAIKQYKPKSFLLSGGVAANKRLREVFVERLKREKLDIKFFAPLPKYATDNAVVIASAAYYLKSPVHWKKVVADPSLTIAEL